MTILQTRMEFLAAFTVLICILPAYQAVAKGKRPNVLFIAVDDLRPELNCYGKSHIKSPSIDRLASQGLLFERAYCQQPICNPSRISIMTGMRPDTTDCIVNTDDFRIEVPNVITLPEYFIKNGYNAAYCGKIYHKNKDARNLRR